MAGSYCEHSSAGSSFPVRKQRFSGWDNLILISSYWSCPCFPFAGKGLSVCQLNYPVPARAIENTHSHCQATLLSLADDTWAPDGEDTLLRPFAYLESDLLLWQLGGVLSPLP